MIMDPDGEGITAKDRAAMLAWKLARGAQLTTSDIASEYQISRKGAARFLNEISRVLPIIRDLDGRWKDVNRIDERDYHDDT